MDLERAKGFEPSTPTLARVCFALLQPAQDSPQARFRRVHLRPAHRGQDARILPGGGRANRCHADSHHPGPGRDAAPGPLELVVPALARSPAAAVRSGGVRRG